MTTDSFSTTRAAAIGEITATLRRGDLAWAQELLNAASLAPETLIAAAEMGMRERRWADAAWFFDQVPHCQGAIGIKRCLCRNLASLRQHRPELYELFIGLAKNDDVGIGTSASGHPTIVHRTGPGRNIALSPGNLPLNGLSAALAHLKPVIDAGTSFALCGLGDGYLLHQLAHRPPTLYLDSEQSIFVLEPNAHVALTALMIHDYTGPQGPIEQKRFQWFIGKDWAARLRGTTFRDLLLPFPHVSIALGLESDAVQKVVNGIVAELQAGDERHRERIAAHYASLDPAEFRAVFGENPPRKPRALFLTTRFSTVLQFSTADTARAFEQAGWETRTLIEPTPYHRIMSIGTREILATFKPDLIFQIDHHRHEHPGMFPANIPFVCWIQDHMEQLMTREAGAKLGPHDFVLTDAGPLYAHNYGYPSRQIIAMPKLTAPPPLLRRPNVPMDGIVPSPPYSGEKVKDRGPSAQECNSREIPSPQFSPLDTGEREQDRPATRQPRSAPRNADLVYVSNNTRSPQALLDVLLAETTGNPVETALLTECWKRLIDLHEAGDSLPNYMDVCKFLRDLIAETGLDVSESRFTSLARAVNHPVCDALYRQQALKWAAAAADELGLTLALYGKGWEAHPEFSRFARGPVAAGRDQQELTRRAAINFQISPYLCLHQRLLDGVCAGGFFLVRRHISDVSPQEMLDLLETHCGSHVTRLSEARACVPPPVRDRFERLVRDCERCLRYSGTEDPIEAVRAFEEARLLQASKGVLPHLDAISFADSASLKDRIVRYMNDAGFREKIVVDQRESIVERFTYASAMRRMVRRIGELLPTETSNAFIGIPINIDIGRAA